MRALNFDNEFRVHENDLIAGVDEAGRGSLAGPVVAACVVLPPGFSHAIIKDSKLMTPAERQCACGIIKANALAFATAYSSHIEIDRFNILQATYLAMVRAFKKITVIPNEVLIDGPRAPAIFHKQNCVIDGDRKSLSIAAASVLAKVFRDRFMDKYHRFYPHYMFSRNKGYGTAYHRHALVSNGPCPIHRMSFAPVRNACFSEGLVI